MLSISQNIKLDPYPQTPNGLKAWYKKTYERKEAMREYLLL